MVTTNRRRNPRVPCDFEAKAFGPRGAIKGAVRNLSVGGLYFLARDPAPVGSTIEIEVTLEGKKVRATAEVRHHLRLEDQAGMGVKFVRVDPAIMEWVQKAVLEHFKEVEPQVS